jgi:hypothetical protein
MSAVSIRSHEVLAGARLCRRLLVVAAVGQAVSSALVSVFGGAFTTADRAERMGHAAQSLFDLTLNRWRHLAYRASWMPGSH